jgi:hypothetical protein
MKSDVRLAPSLVLSIGAKTTDKSSKEPGIIIGCVREGTIEATEEPAKAPLERVSLSLGSSCPFELAARRAKTKEQLRERYVRAKADGISNRQPIPPRSPATSRRSPSAWHRQAQTAKRCGRSPPFRTRRSMNNPKMQRASDLRSTSCRFPHERLFPSAIFVARCPAEFRSNPRSTELSAP